MNVVTNSLAYYDKNMEKYEHLFKKAKYINFPLINEDDKSDITQRVMVMYDEDREETLRSKYEVIGIYESASGTWSWAWSIPRLRKNTAYISRRILNYGLDINVDEAKHLFLKAELITGRFRITNPVQLDVHASVASYITKQPVVYKFIFRRENMDKRSNTVRIVEGNNPIGNHTIYYLFVLDHA